MKTLKTWAAAAAMVALTGAAQAALVPQGNGTVLDDKTNLIWLQDWSVNGSQSLATQNAWAEITLDGFAGSADWRLPEIGEYVALFTHYGNLTQQAVFKNVQPTAYYWSRTEIPNDIEAWFFGPVDNHQERGYEFFPLYAVAVRLGDVAAPVPEPQTLALALLALGATVVARKRRSR